MGSASAKVDFIELKPNRLFAAIVQAIPAKLMGSVNAMLGFLLLEQA